MYRWVSRVQPIPKTEEEEGEATPADEKKTVLSFSVPVSALPPADENAMQVETGAAVPPGFPQTTPPHCDVQGCGELRKYRLVRDFRRGACGMSHLKVLESQTV